jgi:hypothetical protein
MRFSSIALSIATLLAANVLAGPTGNQAEMGNIDKRGCDTGNWCCVQSNPSRYCAKYCTHGSQYLNCYASSVSCQISDGCVECDFNEG